MSLSRGGGNGNVDQVLQANQFVTSTHDHCGLLAAELVLLLNCFCIVFFLQLLRLKTEEEIDELVSVWLLYLGSITW